MHYRIHFEPKGGFWCVQFQRNLFFWDTVHETVPAAEGGPVETKRILKFSNLKEAEAYVASTGIDAAYHRTCTKTPRTAALAGA